MILRPIVIEEPIVEPVVAEPVRPGFVPDAILTGLLMVAPFWAVVAWAVLS